MQCLLTTILAGCLCNVLAARAGRSSRSANASPSRMKEAVMPANDRYPDACNVVWTTPGKSSSDSIPIGNGDIGLNVWVEEGGDLLFYIGKTDAWSADNRLLKIGRMHLSLSPNPFEKGLFFEQTLRLRQGEIEIRAGAREAPVLIRLWVDACHPVIRIEMESPRPLEARLGLELWRTSSRALRGTEMHSAYGSENAVQHADTVVPGLKDRVVWFHRNTSSIYPETMRLQGLESLLDRCPDPLLHRTFGGIMRGEGLISDSPAALKSSGPVRRFTASIHLLTRQTDTEKEWLELLEKQADRAEAVPLSTARAAHRRWWSDFWKRSQIDIDGSPEARTVTQGYGLQRFINACGGRGAYPIKFNGSIFTVDAREPGEEFNADYRRWGGCYWFQNTRLAYWPMLASGDLDLMQPLFRMYRKMLPLAKERTHLYFGHEGAFFPETLTFWGCYANDNYGLNREGKPVSHVDNTYIRHYFSGGLELAALMLDYFAWSGDRSFAKETLLPTGDAVLSFYDQHYLRDTEGRLLFKPAQALETWQEVVNPLPEIAGLSWVLDGLLGLPPDLTGLERRDSWQRLLAGLPPLPLITENGRTCLAPAREILAPAMNSENPELYAIFPYRLYGLGKPGMETALRTFERRQFKGNEGWRQDPIQAALLGLGDQAKQMVIQRFSTKHAGSRFPAFWGPNYDWIPDQDHGSVALMALQAMLMQTDGNRILLFPAWPKEWNVRFRLHAPRKTVVQGRYQNGRLESLKVSPSRRAKDISVLL